VGLLLVLKLIVSFLRLQLVEKVKAGVEFRHVQGLSRSLPRDQERRLNVKDTCHQRGA
jgi:hypothetical protein